MCYRIDNEFVELDEPFDVTDIADAADLARKIEVLGRQDAACPYEVLTHFHYEDGRCWMWVDGCMSVDFYEQYQDLLYDFGLID